MYRDKKKVTINLEFEYEYENDLNELITLINQIMALKILTSIDYKRES